MRIGIDATAIPPRRTGAGNYIFQLIKNLAVIDTRNSYIIFAKPDHIAEWKIEQANFQFISVPLHNRAKRLAWEQTGLPILASRYRLDLLHSPHYTIPLPLTCKSVVTFHDMIFFLYPELYGRFRQQFFTTMMRLSARKADAILTDSQSTAEDLHKILGTQRNKIFPVLLACDRHYQPVTDLSQVNQICTSYGLSPNQYFLYVGVLEPRKNIPVLLQALRNLLDHGFEHRLAITGKKGWMFDEIFATVKRLQLHPHVIFTGYVPEEHLPFLYTGCTASIYPSLYEGFGMPVLEALACGTPVITSNISSMPEITADAALLIDPHSAEQLTTAMEQMLSNEGLREQLKKRALTRAIEFSWEKTAQETLKIYSATVDKN